MKLSASMRRSLESAIRAEPPPAELTIAPNLSLEARIQAVTAHTKGPKSYSPALGNSILQAVLQGNSHKTAAASVGISEHSLNHWLKLGQDGVEPYHTFSTELSQATAGAVMTSVEAVKQGKPNWQAHAWWLERAHPKDWGKQESSGLTLTLQTEQRTPADARRIMSEQFGNISPEPPKLLPSGE